MRTFRDPTLMGSERPEIGEISQFLLKRVGDLMGFPLKRGENLAAFGIVLGDFMGV